MKEKEPYQQLVDAITEMGWGISGCIAFGLLVLFVKIFGDPPDEE